MSNILFVQRDQGGQGIKIDYNSGKIRPPSSLFHYPAFQIFADQTVCLLHKFTSSSSDGFDELLLSYRFQPVAHTVFPSLLRWSLRYEEPVCPRCQRWHQGQISKKNVQIYFKHDMFDNCSMWVRIVLFVVAWQCQTHPQWRPITSRTKVRWWLQRVNNIYTEMQLKICRINKNIRIQYCLLDLCAVVMIASIISMMRCSAESAPMVMSVPQKSLSMEPTKPTMFRWPCCLASVSEILPEAARDCYWTCFTGYNNATINISNQWCLQGLSA